MSSSEVLFELELGGNPFLSFVSRRAEGTDIVSWVVSTRIVILVHRKLAPSSCSQRDMVAASKPCDEQMTQPWLQSAKMVLNETETGTGKSGKPGRHGGLRGYRHSYMVDMVVVLAGVRAMSPGEVDDEMPRRGISGVLMRVSTLVCHVNVEEVDERVALMAWLWIWSHWPVRIEVGVNQGESTPLYGVPGAVGSSHHEF